MIPGEYKIFDGELELNYNRKKIFLVVKNNGDRPIQIGSHYHFYEINTALIFDREKTKGFRLDIPAGTAIRFEPGQKRKVVLVKFSGLGNIFGFQGKIMGFLR